MKKVILLTGAIAAGILAAPVHAGFLDASADLAARADGANFDYTLTLTNSAASTESLETFWFSWSPGKDFMPSSPFRIKPPAQWAETITHGGPTDGFAIQFTTLRDALAPGQSVDFTFTSALAPDQFAGDTPLHPGNPVGTAAVFQGQPFQGDTASIVVNAVPEPSSLIQGALGVMACGGWGSLRRRARRRAAPLPAAAR